MSEEKVLDISLSRLAKPNENKQILNSTQKQDGIEQQPVHKVAERKDVKSSAVVKYVHMEGPAKFLKLQQDTNLNEPPANWLHGGSKWDNYLRDSTLRRGRDKSPFSSFKMAYAFPELTGDVDIVSDAENIKKLLKIPWSKDHVSMMVHRVGNTLLLDDFDIHKHLLRKQQEDWQWMRKFFYETIMRNMGNNAKNMISKKNKSRIHLQNRNLESKFLYYSANASDQTENESPPSRVQTFSEPDMSNQVFEPQVGPHRTVHWEFEDLNMLIGTDLPIFGGNTHPCVSLKLRDMSKPISVLTGLDYWLDNLISNVPELAMCFHVDGIVKCYELLKTEEIPNIPDSKFSPTVVKDIATNILSFLKSNATKEGHTYWLFKAHDDDIVKLYDLSTLCADTMNEQSANPFTVPVGILLFRVAQNMWQNTGREHSGTIRALLQKCLLLLNNQTHAQVLAMANFILSDVHISNDIHNIREDTPPPSDESDIEETEYCSDSGAETSVEVQDLRVADSMKKTAKDLVRYPAVSGDIEQRCRESLKFIAQGLIATHTNLQDEKNKSKYQVDQQEQCNPFEPIPLHYESLSENKGQIYELGSSSATDTQTERKHMISVLERTAKEGSWHLFSETLLFRKSVVAFFGLAEAMFKSKKYGHALKFLKQSMICFQASEKLNQSGMSSNYQKIQSSLLSLAGDCHMMLSHQRVGLQEQMDDYRSVTEDEINIQEYALQEIETSECIQECEIQIKIHDCLLKAVKCYKMALDLFAGNQQNKTEFKTLSKRYGNSQNELGVSLMNSGASKISHASDVCVSQDILPLLDKSATCFSKGIDAFEEINDDVNAALLYSNTGRLMRVYVQSAGIGLSGDTPREITPSERLYFIQSIESYKSALSKLKSRNVCPEIWDSINWELSSTFFSLATMLQDYAPLSTQSHEQVEKEVTELMNKALKHCDIDTPNARQTTCQYRAANIHHRLASLYHNSYRNKLTEHKQKHLRTLAELHYDKASHLFDLTESPCESLRVQLERVAMCEHQFLNQTSNFNKVKTLELALKYLLNSEATLGSIQQSFEENDENCTITTHREELSRLLPILHSRLNFVLHNLVKFTTMVKKGKQESSWTDTYKAMYGTVLKSTSIDSQPADIICRMELELVTKLRHIFDNKG